jgi:hypothetical protein
MAAARAEQVWLTWRRSRPDWIGTLKYHRALTEKLAGISAQALYLQEVQQPARDALRGIPDMLPTPQEFRGKLEQLTGQVNSFDALEARNDGVGAGGRGAGVSQPP